jgi:hypothetical protein
MKRIFIILMIIFSLALMGCESRLGTAGLGAAGGAAAGAGGYEWKMNQEMSRIEEERRQGRMSQEEFEIRRDQIHRMSILR